jgi:hypothetical protein
MSLMKNRFSTSTIKYPTPVTKNVVKSMIQNRKEIKSIAVATAYVNTVAGVVNILTQQLVTGDAVNNRDGSAIRPSYIEMVYTLLNGVGSTNSLHRIIIFQDLQNTGVLPTVAQVLDGGLLYSTYTILNRQQRRFHILHDEIHGVVGGANSAATHVHKRIKLKGEIKYNGDTNATASNGPGAIFMLSVTDSVAVGTATFSFYANTFFTDA